MTITIVLVILGAAYLGLKARFKAKQESEEPHNETETKTFRAHIAGSFKCESCGASVRITASNKSIACPFCGARLPEAEKHLTSKDNAH